MKKYIRFIIIFNIFLIFVIFFYPYFLERTYLSVESIKRYYLEKSHPYVSTLILGDSTVAYGIRPLLIKNSTSLALPGSTNINVYFEFKRYLDHFSSPKCLIYSTAYIKNHYYEFFLGKHMSANMYSWNEILDFYSNSKLASVAPASEMSFPYYYLKTFYLKYLHVTINTQIKIKEKLFPFLKEAELFKTNLENVISEKGYLKSHGEGKNFITDRHDYFFLPFAPIPTEDYYFDQILKLAAEKNIKFIFVEMPLLDIENKAFNDFNNSHIKHVDSLLKSYKNTSLIRVKIVNDVSRFYDANHLNLKGATEFTSLIKDKIELECL